MICALLNVSIVITDKIRYTYFYRQSDLFGENQIIAQAHYRATCAVSGDFDCILICTGTLHNNVQNVIVELRCLIL